MAKGQRSSKEPKKPKKDVASSKPVSFAEPVRMPVTNILPKGKEKNKLK
jgi:hypothetical protein